MDIDLKNVAISHSPYLLYFKLYDSTKTSNKIAVDTATIAFPNKLCIFETYFLKGMMTSDLFFRLFHFSLSITSSQQRTHLNLLVFASH